MFKTISKCVLSTAGVALFAGSLFLALAPAASATPPRPDNGNKVYCGTVQCGCMTIAPSYNCYWGA